MNSVIRKYILCLLGGFLIPIIFVLIDLWQLELEPNLSNLYDVIVGQNIYRFSLGFFPLVFATVLYLYENVRKSNELLKKEFEYLKLLFDANPDAVLFIDSHQEPIFYNTQFKIYFNHLLDTLKEIQAAANFTEVSFLQTEVILKSNLDQQHPFNLNVKQVEYNDSPHFFISLKDIKSLKEKETIIQEQNQQMIEKNKLASLGEMAAGIAHEINNPLTVISSNNAILAKLDNANKLTSQQVERLTTKTSNQVKRITEIIKSLRNLSRGLANDEMENFDLQLLLDEALKLAKLRDKSKKILFQLDNIKCFGFGNRGQIVQVVINLINNAIDAIEEQDSPWIHIKVEERKNYINVSIVDSGVGIAPDQIQKIFVPMFTTKGVGKGTGLGLSLSRSFMEQNKGSLDYQVVEGHTCFKISILKGLANESEDAA